MFQYKSNPLVCCWNNVFLAILCSLLIQFLHIWSFLAHILTLLAIFSYFWCIFLISWGGQIQPKLWMTVWQHVNILAVCNWWPQWCTTFPGAVSELCTGFLVVRMWVSCTLHADKAWPQAVPYCTGSPGCGLLGQRDCRCLCLNHQQAVFASWHWHLLLIFGFIWNYVYHLGNFFMFSCQTIYDFDIFGYFWLIFLTFHAKLLMVLVFRGYPW